MQFLYIQKNKCLKVIKYVVTLLNNNSADIDQSVFSNNSNNLIILSEKDPQKTNKHLRSGITAKKYKKTNPMA